MLLHLPLLSLLGLPALAISLPSPQPQSIPIPTGAVATYLEDRAAAFSATGLRFNITLPLPLSDTSDSDSDTISTLAYNDHVWVDYGGWHWGILYCETSYGSPLAWDVYQASFQFDDGASFASEFHGCTPLYSPYGTATLGFCGDLTPGHKLTGAIAKYLFHNIAYYCEDFGGLAGGQAVVGDDFQWRLLAYHS